MPGLVDVVEGVEKLLLRGLFSGDELYVVHKKQVDIAVFVPEFFGFTGLDGLYHLVCELVALYIGYLLFRVAGVDLLAYREQQMGLSEAGVAVNEQGVIGPSGVFGHGHGGGVGKLVGRTDYEPVESISVHLREVVGAFFAGEVFLKLVPRQDLQLELAGEQIVERGANHAAEARLDYPALEVSGRVQHELAVVELDGLAVGKPGVIGRRRYVLCYYIEYALPYLRNGIHSYSSKQKMGDFTPRTARFIHSALHGAQSTCLYFRRALKDAGTGRFKTGNPKIQTPCSYYTRRLNSYQDYTLL